MERPRRPAVLRSALLVVAVVVAFLPTLTGGFVVWDDDLNFTLNPSYRGLSLDHLRWMATTFHGGQWQPLSWLTLAVDWELWGMWAPGYHLTSLVLHAANAVLVALVVEALLAAAGVGGRRVGLGVLAGTLVWALHPLRVESVAWATARRDVLSGFFYLIAVLAYLRMVEAKARGARSSGWYAGAVVAFACSLLAKGWGVTLPAVLLLLDVYPLRRRGPIGLVIEKLPFALVAAVDAAILGRMLHQFTAARTLADYGIAARVAQASYGLVFYVWKTLVPAGLSALYPLAPTLDPWQPRWLVCEGVVGAATVALVAMRRRWPWALAAWAAYVVIVLPVLGVLQIGPQIAADRYTYLASLPASVLVAAGVARLPAFPARLATALVAAFLGVLTFRQTRVWHDTRSLWEHAIAVDPDNDFAELNLGADRAAAGDVAGAERHYDAAIRINPRFTFAYNNRGNLRRARGDVDGALADYAAAIQANAAYATPYLNRGTIHLARHEWDAAIADFDTFLSLTPDDGRGYNNRAIARRGKGDVAGAVADYTEALKRFPPGTPGREMIEQNLNDARAELEQKK